MWFLFTGAILTWDNLTNVAKIGDIMTRDILTGDLLTWINLYNMHIFKHPKIENETNYRGEHFLFSFLISIKRTCLFAEYPTKIQICGTQMKLQNVILSVSISHLQFDNEEHTKCIIIFLQVFHIQMHMYCCQNKLLSTHDTYSYVL